ncbi:MAG TPA: branched-chain amino acid ABC transporter permease [Chloroflexota bacterium]|nr:branched-chain amino acid ABC transporter permease [Chloroflexota bacterium]
MKRAKNPWAWFRRCPWLLPALAALVTLACLPLISTTSFAVGFLDPAGTYAILALGLNLLIGGTGQFSLGHAGFFAIGAFTAGILSTNYGWPFWVVIPVAGVVAGLFGAALGLPTLRLIGPYFSMATLGFGLLTAEVLGAASWAGGRTGITLNYPQLGAYTFDEVSFFWVILGVAAVTLFLVWNLRHGATGRAFVALRESDFAARACGIHLARYRVLAFTISAVLAGIAGSLFANWNGFLDASESATSSTFGLPASVAFVAMVVVGGLDSTLGSILGAVFITAVQYWLQDRPELAEMLYGASIVIVLLGAKGGLAGLPAMVYTAWRNLRARGTGEARA